MNKQTKPQIIDESISGHSLKLQMNIINFMTEFQLQRKWLSKCGTNDFENVLNLAHVLASVLMKKKPNQFR